ESDPVHACSITSRTHDSGNMAPVPGRRLSIDSLAIGVEAVAGKVKASCNSAGKLRVICLNARVQITDIAARARKAERIGFGVIDHVPAGWTLISSDAPSLQRALRIGVDDTR